MKEQQRNLTNDEFQKICDLSIGMTVEDFDLLGWNYRHVEVDGRPCVVTCDFKPTRFNLTTINNIITECHGG